MRTLELETFLPAETEIVWDHILQSRLLCYGAKGMLTFRPINPDRFPERWRDGQYRVQKYLWGVLPIGWQVIEIQIVQARGQTHRVRDNGCGWLVATWDHTIDVEPLDGGTLYTDRVSIEAGILTPFVAAFARRFYEHRQKRWRKLVMADFDYTAS